MKHSSPVLGARLQLEEACKPCMDVLVLHNTFVERTDGHVSGCVERVSKGANSSRMTTRQSRSRSMN
eukprot:3325469-Amphidinium_carterae.1